MKINDNREQLMQPFNSIHTLGEVFEYAGEIYILIEEVKDEDNHYYNAVCLKDGELAYFIHEQVQVLNDVTLEIH